MANPPSPDLLHALEQLLGPKGFSRDPADLEPWLTDWRGRYHGKAAALLSPASTQETAAIVRLCADAGTALVPAGRQHLDGGRGDAFAGRQCPPCSRRGE